jgi:hypothetical protein
MTQESRTSKLLEVAVSNPSENSWEWKVVAREEIVVIGYEPTRLAARVAGNDALFHILALGWNA